jgi:catechol 2,3-dioxygenase-like lactoylglutathione lyase family enzyme
MAGIKVQQIDHVELFVPDRYEAAGWYKDVLGLEIVPQFEFWAEDEDGPLMISSDGGSTKLALFHGEPQGSRDAYGHKRVAFKTDGQGFMQFLSEIKSKEIYDKVGRRLTNNDIVDHDQAYSVYFSDPYGHAYEVTTYDYDYVKSLF